VVTEADIDYVGSITLDRDLLELSGIRPGEKVLVADLSSAARFETYVIEAPAGSGTVCINGAAARLASPGDRIIVMQFVQLDTESEEPPLPRVVMADDSNRNPRLLT
jgi:aspartate 1-decarboxylase